MQVAGHRAGLSICDQQQEQKQEQQVPLKVVMVDAFIRRPTERMAVDNGNCLGPVECPVKYSAQEISQCRNELKQVDEARQELAELREIIGIDSVGWVPDNEHLE